jgi:hypothetical protein
MRHPSQGIPKHSSELTASFPPAHQDQPELARQNIWCCNQLLPIEHVTLITNARVHFTSSILLKISPASKSQKQTFNETLASSFSTSRKWWRMTGSNRRPPACKAGALPAELIPHLNKPSHYTPQVRPANQASCSLAFIS